jgi:FAD/FMN-containing dehydrogenase
MGSTNIHSSSELSAARELRAMMKEESCYAATMTMLARGRYGTEQWRTSQRHLRCVRRPRTCGAVRVARRHGIPFSVRCGGHHWAGFASGRVHFVATFN